jgi:heterodisulfide reductase subunit A-like polyferredoxin
MKKQNGNGKVGAVLVVGGGIGGVQASLDLAESGYYVYLVEKSPSIGGVMAQLDKTFPTNDCSMCILSPKLVEVASHQNVALHAYTEIESISGEAGNFTVKLRRKATYVDWDKCTGCGVCSEWCPVVMKSEFNAGLGNRRAIYTPFPQAVPKKCVIDKREERLCRAACRDACPIHMNVPGYIKLIAEGQNEEAYRLIRATNPLPGICGRICYAPCQEACNRCQIDESLAIRDLKRFASDSVDLDKLEVPTVEPTGKKVAIIGAGPAGLVAAHDLALKGHKAIIFETLPKPGGMLQVGIPEYRLPKELVRKEIEYIAKLGVDIKTGVEVGKDVSLGELRKEFNAIFIGIGAHQGVELKVPGEKLPGVLQGVEFLRNVNLGKKVRVGRKVAVIGGGNTALDCARTAKRVGAEEVTILYRRTRAEMPASAEEIDGAEAEGIKIEFLVAPSRFVGSKRLSKIELIRMKLGAADASGRARPVPIEGSEFQMPVNTVIAALGQAAKTDFLKGLGVSLSKRRTIEADASTGATNIEGVFAGGDVVTGPAFVVDAMAAGRRAGRSIDAFLNGLPLPVEERQEPQKLTDEEIRNLKNRFDQTSQHKIAEIPVEQREGFEEVTLGYAPQEACREAERCLAGQATGCIECLECVDRCEAEAIDHSMKDIFEEINVGAIVFAGGYECYNPSELYELGYGRLPNVVTSIEFERILSASGPFQGVLQRLSDGLPPQKIAFIQCVGSRDTKHNRPYCSSVCCTYAIKEAMIAKEHSTVQLDITIFFMDLRTYGKDFDRYYERARDEVGVQFVRSKVYSIEAVDSTGDLLVRFTTEDGAVKIEKFSMVVLSVGFESSPELVELAREVGIQLNPYGFCQTMPFSPVETSKPGIFVCGAFSAPKDIPETVMQASGAAGEISAFLAPARKTLTREREYPPERDVAGEEPRIGVFICHCGINIGGYVNVPDVTEFTKSLPNVVYAERNLFTCSQDTQERIEKAVEEYKLNRVVVASCTPRTHEPLFRETIRKAGLNPYLFEMANIRDQCSWVHMHEPDKATEKAEDLVKMAVAKARLIEPLKPLSLPVNRSALVVGGGVAGMTSALTLAEQGFEVHLIEKGNVLGGIARRIHYDLDGRDIEQFLGKLIGRVQGHPRIRVYTDTWIVDVHGYVGNFTTEIMRYRGRVIEKIDHGVAIIATGADEYKPDEYLYGRDPRVLTQLELEEEIVKKNPDIVNCDNLVMIQCVGCRNEERPYCSRVCCSEAIKNALKLKEMKPQMNIYVLYRDIRTYGFYEEYYEEARRKGIVFLHYDLEDKPRVRQERKGSELLLRVQTKDEVIGDEIAIDADILVLSAAMVSSPDVRELAMLYKVPVNEDGFFLEAHVKLRPVDFATDGVFVCGLAHAPKSLEESIAQAKAAASRATTILVKDAIIGEGIVASVDEALCSGCGVCEVLCPYGAIAVDREKGVSVVNQALCKGCGTCCAACPSGAVQQRGFTRKEISAMLDAALAGVR